MDSSAEIVKALDRIGRILTVVVLRDMEDMDQIKKIARLKECGLQNAEIANMLGTTANTVNVAVHSLRRKGRSKTAGKRRRPTEPK